LLNSQEDAHYIHYLGHNSQAVCKLILYRDLGLRRPIFQKTAAYGHFGRDDPDFTWENPKKLVY